MKLRNYHNWYTSKPLSAIISEYKTNSTPFTKSKNYKKRIRDLAQQLTNFSLAKNGYGLDLREIYYAYLYLDTRYPAEYEGQYRFVLPSGRVVNFSHRPLYAGKGTGKRLIAHLEQAKSGEGNTRKVRTLRKLKDLQLEPIIIATEDLVDEATAFAYEIDLIAGLGRSDLKLGPLANLCDGGGGATGAVHSEEANDAKSARMMGKDWGVRTEQHKANLSAANSGREQSAESNAQRSKTMTGVKKPPRTAEHTANLRASRKDKPLSEAQVAANTARRGTKSSSVAIKNMSKAKKGVPWSAARRAAQGALTAEKKAATHAKRLETRRSSTEARGSW